MMNWLKKVNTVNNKPPIGGSVSKKNMIQTNKTLQKD